MTYVSRFGRPNLFDTFTCNSAWENISKFLPHGKAPVDRRDIVARIFRQKLLKLMDLIVKSKLFGEVIDRKELYHIVIWLKQKIRPDQIDCVMSAEIPDSEMDYQLYNIFKKK